MILKELILHEIEQFEFNTLLTGGILLEIASINEKPILQRLHQVPRRDNFYAIFWIEEGQGTYFIDFEEYPIERGMLFCVALGQVHYWQLTQAINGKVILFMPDLLTTHTLQRFPQDFAIFNWNTPAGYRVEDTQQPYIRQLMTIITNEAEQKR